MMERKKGKKKRRLGTRIKRQVSMSEQPKEVVCNSFVHEDQRGSLIFLFFG
jgi:hypothetical protein